MRYRSIYCIECGTPVLERNSGIVYRFSQDQPTEVSILPGLAIEATCPRCVQKYELRVSVSVSYDPDSPALYMQPQTIQLATEQTKYLRDYHCMECGKSMNLISDRIAFVSDNRVPFEHVDPNKPGPVGTYCPAGSCHQYWTLMM